MALKTKEHQHSPTCGCVLTPPSIRRRVQIFFPEPSLTKQDDLEASDINNIIALYRVTGDEAPFSKRKPLYADVTNLPDYLTIRKTIAEADYQFSLLPSALRGQFHNDPQIFIDWLSDPQNRPQAVEMGLLPAPVSKTTESATTSNPRAVKSKTTAGSEEKTKAGTAAVAGGTEPEVPN